MTSDPPIQSLRLWLPTDNQSWHALYRQGSREVGQTIPAYFRIKREVFEISGGSIGDHLSASDT